MTAARSALGQATGVALSSDGRHAYVPGFIRNTSVGALAVFARNAKTGALTQLQGQAGCVVDDEQQGCADGRALDSPIDAVASPDGRNVYVSTASVATGADSGGVAVFARDRRSGALTQLTGEDGCVDQAGLDDCALGRAIEAARGLAVSPDGKNIYIASNGRSAVAAFARDHRTGALTQLQGEDGCVANEVGEGCALGRALGLPLRTA